MVTNKTILFYFLVILSVTYTKSQFMDSSFGFLGGDLSNALNYLVNKQYKNLNTSLRNYNQTIIPLLNVTIREYNRKSIGNNPKNRLKNIDLNKNRNKVVNHLKHNNINNINSINSINSINNIKFKDQYGDSIKLSESNFIYIKECILEPGRNTSVCFIIENSDS